MPRQARKPCSGCGRCFEDQFAERRRRRSDQARVGADALDRPAGVSPMAGRHVFGNGRVLVIAAHAHVRGDPLALEEDFDRPARSAARRPRRGRSDRERCNNERRPRCDNRCRRGKSAIRRTRKVRSEADFSAGRSICSSNCRRVTPSRRIGRSSLRCVISSAIAALTSARL